MNRKVSEHNRDEQAKQFIASMPAHAAIDVLAVLLPYYAGERNISKKFAYADNLLQQITARDGQMHILSFIAELRDDDDPVFNVSPDEITAFIAEGIRKDRISINTSTETIAYNKLLLDIDYITRVNRDLKQPDVFDPGYVPVYKKPTSEDSLIATEMRHEEEQFRNLASFFFITANVYVNDLNRYANSLPVPTT